jgi:transcription initiation factor TFIIH subunit 2
MSLLNENRINSSVSISGLISNPEELLDLGGDELNDRTNAWTAPIQRSWEEIEEDTETGQLKSLTLQQQKQRKAKIARSEGIVIEKGVIRYLYIIIDLSVAIESNDIKPTRKVVTLDLLELFIVEFFAQNPISQLGFIISHNKIAEKITELSGNPQDQIRKLRARCDQLNTGGELSLQNSLELAWSSLSQIPPYGSREILIIMASLSTTDSSDIYQTINACTQQYITISTIHLAAEVYICTQLASKTHGSHSVIMNASHYKELLYNHIPPLPIHIDRQRVRTRRWIRMGFPEQKFETYPAICACHQQLKYGGHLCPTCRARYCELPTTCKICNLTLVSSPHLARSYHHLFPVPYYAEISMETNNDNNPVNCYSCMKLLEPSQDIVVQCEQCKELFCIDCDEYIHLTLNNCPSNHCRRPKAAATVGFNTALPGNESPASIAINPKVESEEKMIDGK